MNEHSGKNEHRTTGAPLAKLTLPRLLRGIPRPRLFAILDEGRKGDATWIVASGGAGKTTLAATYIVERKFPYLWYQLDQDDTDPATFFYYLGIAARQACPDRDVFLPLLTPEYLRDVPGFARRYFRQLFALLPAGTVLVLDNFQTVGESPILAEILRSAIEEIPPDAALVAISRSHPPAELARAVLHGTLKILDWETLRLTLEETQAIAAQHQLLDDNLLQALHKRAGGWPAAVTLLVEQIKRKGMDTWETEHHSLETVFQYFASEYFDTLSHVTQDFLLKTALLAHMSASLAEQVSGHHDAASILADLHRRHFFTNRRELKEPHYQYHDLFREFLLTRAEATFSREQYLALTRKAGQLLTEHQRQDEAIALHLRAKDWERAIPLILELAPQRLGQGRAQIVADWLDQLPPQLIDTMPWLMYWRGMSQIGVQPSVAITTLRQAFDKFIGEENGVGRLLTASAIVDLTYLLRMNLLATAPWIDTIQKELELNPRFPSPMVEARILTSLLTVLIYTQPYNVRLPEYAQRLTALLDHVADVNQKVNMGAQLAHYYALIEGNIGACDRIAFRMTALLTSPEITPMMQIRWRMLSSAFTVIAFRRDDIVQSVTPVLSIIRDNDLYFLEGVAHTYTILARLNTGETGDIQALLDRMKVLGSATYPGDLSFYFLMCSAMALTDKNYADAIKYGETALRLISEGGATISKIDFRCVYAIACCETNDAEGALTHLAATKNQGFQNSPRIRHQVLQIEAYAQLKKGDTEESHKLLRQAFSIARQHGFFGCWAFWHVPMMSRLCAEALRAGIEVNYVQQLIRKRKLIPEDSTIQSWPWPVRIYILGRFQVVIEDQEFVATKGQRKPLALLRVLIALDGKNVKSERIAEILWPDAEGDAAVSAFTTTLSRLRKLIGDEALQVKSGRVSLNEKYCWVDVWALERQLARFDELAVADIPDYGEQVLDLYRGPFLDDEEGDWSWRLRDRLRTRISRAIDNCVKSLEAAGESSLAAHLLDKAAEADPEIARSQRGLFSNRMPSNDNWYA